MAEQLTVRVDQNSVGLLHREKAEFIFNYEALVFSDDFISLTMPVRAKGYVHSQLLPVFEMHLPEGYLLSLLKKQFSKLTETDDFGLLSLLASSIRGRVNYKGLTSTESTLALSDLLHSKQPELFNELVVRFALKSPLSGVQPKVLVQVENKATLKLDDYIVKSWGSDYPQLALNEFFCMTVVKEAGITVPEFYLSDDETLFVMKRFDITADGACLGFEDMCVLQAKQRDDKYTGSYEQVAKTIKLFTSPDLRRASLQQFFKMVVLNNVLQNGDAHLKNFGLIYEDVHSIRLAPAYDVVSTTAYIKNDIAALTLLGSKKWWKRDFLIRFGVETCDLTAKEARFLVEECQVALAKVHKKIQARLVLEKDGDKLNVLSHLATLMSLR
ncbi:MAG: type II toxin-antitoxin system HipA family toxin [Gammaproteobacteria bacterium]|nr:type II toxin-antitoxin system HipA family toxin [Gammaproteobacteria bacterium]